MLTAAIDVGSNSVHLLVARLSDGRLELVRDESEQLGLGDTVDREGSIPLDRRRQAVAALRRYVELAREDGAEQPTMLATEPLRRASNRDALVAEARRATGLPLTVIDEQQEGALTFLGVTGGMAPPEPLLVIDIGGGSTEVVHYTPGTGLIVSALATGSARLTLGIEVHDPPTPADLERLRGLAHELVRALPRAAHARAVFVGGTATNLLRLAPLRPDGLTIAYEVLASQPSAALAERHGVSLRRASQMAAGAAIVEALLAHFALEEGSVSNASLREGTILAVAALGDDFLGRLHELTTRQVAIEVSI